MFNRFYCKYILAGLVVSVSVVQGCAVSSLKEVSENDRDLSGEFEGRWIGRVTSTASRQPIGRGFLACSDGTGRTYSFIVSDGNISTSTASSFVDSDGNFRIVAPSNIRYSVQGGSKVTGDNNLILRGSLKSKVGFEKHTSSALNGNGCSSKLELVKL